MMVPPVVTIGIGARAGRVLPIIRFEPVAADRLLRQQTVDCAARTARTIHGLCGRAHEVACRRACEAAVSTRPHRSREAARDVVLLIESTVAQARRVALDLAPATGRAVPVGSLKAVIDAARLAEVALGLSDAAGPITPQVNRLEEALDHLADAAQTLLAEVDETPPEDQLRQLPTAIRDLVASGWQRPWHHAATVLAPGFGPLVGKLAAEPGLPPLGTGNGWGRGGAGTSRGPLTYDVQVHRGRVTGCAIRTPTDRVLAPGGDLEMALSGLPAGGAVSTLADLVVRALDPCAPWSIKPADPADA